MRGRDARLRKLENLTEDIIERQRLSRLDAVIFLLFPVLLLIMSATITTILNYQSVTAIPLIGAFIKVMTIFLIVILGALFWTFFAFVRAYLRDELKGRISACSLACAYAILFLIFTGEAILPDVVSRLGDGQRWLIPSSLLVFFFVTLFTAASLFSASIQAVVSGQVAAWLEGNVPRKWKAANFPTKNVPLYKHAFFEMGRWTFLFACGSYVILIVLAHNRGVSVSAVQFGLLAILVLLAIVVLRGGTSG
jgi:hypothetical protein